MRFQSNNKSSIFQQHFHKKSYFRPPKPSKNQFNTKTQTVIVLRTKNHQTVTIHNIISNGYSRITPHYQFNTHNSNIQVKNQKGHHKNT